MFISVIVLGEGSTPEDSPCQQGSSPGPESDLYPHVNIGPQFQCAVPQWHWRADSSHPAREVSHDHLLWDPGISKVTSDSEG